MTRVPRAGLFGTTSRKTRHGTGANASIQRRASPRKRPPAPDSTFGRMRLTRRDDRADGPTCRQVFGLVDTDLATHLAPRFPGLASQCTRWSSFPLTAAGQLRIYTGFPFNPAPPRTLRGGAEHRRDTSYCVRRIESTDYFVVGGLHFPQRQAPRGLQRGRSSACVARCSRSRSSLGSRRAAPQGMSSP